MRNKLRHFPVNWMDGMKMNKNTFITQDHAVRDALQQAVSLSLSPVRYGILPPDAEGGETCAVRMTLDNQLTLRAAVLACQAVTPGGAFVCIPGIGQQETDGVPAVTFDFRLGAGEMTYWLVLVVHAFDGVPAGSPDPGENPPRLPWALPRYSLRVCDESMYRQYAVHPDALTLGKLAVTGNAVRVCEDYIPPCYSVNAHADMLALYSELDSFLGSLELRCSKIVQKIYRRNQQNELSELVLFVCDRVLLHIGQAVTALRWRLVHESPVCLFEAVAALARIMKNTIDLRIGSGKDELLNYLSEWCELKQGELEAMLTDLANFRYNHNDINQCIESISLFIKVTGRLFATLSNLEFIGKRREAGFFVKEEQQEYNAVLHPQNNNKTRRRFFGN